MRRSVFLLIGLTAIVGLAVSSGAFTSTSADRGVAVSVVGDEDAYMALDYDGHNYGNGGGFDTIHSHGQGFDANHSHGEGLDLGHVHGNSTNSGNDASDGDVTFVTVTNQFTEEVAITVDYTVESDDGSSSGSETKQNVGVGEEFSVSVAFDCESHGPQDATVSFDVEASGDSVSAATSESRHVEYRVICNNKRDNSTQTNNSTQ